MSFVDLCWVVLVVTWLCLLGSVLLIAAGIAVDWLDDHADRRREQ